MKIIAVVTNIQSRHAWQRLQKCIGSA